MRYANCRILLTLSAVTLLGLLLCTPAMAQSLTLDMGGDSAGNGSVANRIVQILALTTVLSLAPSIFMMVTSFTRIVVVLSLLRNAMGLQQTPPNAVIVGLAMFLTFFIMTPTFEAAWTDGIQPMINEKLDTPTALMRTANHFKTFMIAHTYEDDLKLFTDMSKSGPYAKAEDVPLQVVTPAFMISELKRAFEIGFLIFIPFLIIDMVVASILMSMGMMMLPPIMISMPFKLIFFVLVDGWKLVCSSLVQSYATGGG